jgi:hypothetical protein
MPQCPNGFTLVGRSCAQAYIQKKGVTREFIVIHQKKRSLPCFGTLANAENSME